MEEKSKDEFYTVNELVVMLKVSRETIFNYLHSGELQATKIGNKIRVNKEALDRFLLNRQYTYK